MRALFGILAGLFGIGFAACEVWGAYEYLHHDQGTINYIVLSGAGLAAVVSLLPAFAALAWDGRPGLSLALWVLFVGSLVIVNVAGISRTGSATDEGQRQREKLTTQGGLALDAYNEAKANLDKDDKSVADECKSGRGRKCLDAEARRDETRKTVNKARGQLVDAPPEQQDPMAARIVKLVPWTVTEEQVRLYMPIGVPVAVSCLSAALLSLAAWLLSGVMRKPEPEIIPPAAAPPVTAKPTRVARGNVSQFLLAVLMPANGNQTRLNELFRAYRAWCQAEGFEPLPADKFVPELQRIFTKASIATREDGDTVYCLDVKLAS